MTILLWLGSGFAFAIGVCLGAMLMLWVMKAPENQAKKRAEKHYQTTKALLAQRNGLLSEQNRLVSKILTVVLKSEAERVEIYKQHNEHDGTEKH